MKSANVKDYMAGVVKKLSEVVPQKAICICFFLFSKMNILFVLLKLSCNGSV